MRAPPGEEYPDPPYPPRLLRLGGERRGEGAGQRCQREAAAVHAGTVGRKGEGQSTPTAHTVAQHLAVGPYRFVAVRTRVMTDHQPFSILGAATPEP
jgi:hypothetical protein